MKGDQGDKGYQGVKCEEGEKGDKGNKGHDAFEFWQMLEYENIAETGSTQESNGLALYKESIKGETVLTDQDASGWVWDLVNTGLTAASFEAL